MLSRKRKWDAVVSLTPNVTLSLGDTQLCVSTPAMPWEAVFRVLVINLALVKRCESGSIVIAIEI